LEQAEQVERLVQIEALTELIRYFLQLHQLAADQVLTNPDPPMTGDLEEDLVMLVHLQA
jgi:hypothetical protein